MKRFLFIFGILFFPFVSFSEPNPKSGADQETFIKDLSKGMWSNPSSNIIPDGSAAFIQNFYTDIQPMAVERNGYAKRDTTVLGGVKPVSGLWKFLDTSGSEWIISYSSRTYYKNTVGGTPTAFGPVTTTNQIPVAAINSGKIAFTDGTDNLWWFNGTSTGAVASAPKGKLIAPWRTRFVIGNVSGSLTTLYYSGDDDITNWVLGGNPTDPFTRLIGGANNGQYIRCLYGVYQDALIIGTQYSLWAQAGTDQSDDVVRNISSEIGCLDNGSIREFDGSLMFLSARGLEEMQGFLINYVAEPIRDLTDVLVKNTQSQHFNVQTTQADWSAGTWDNNVYVDTITVPGNLQFTFPDLFSTYRDGTSGTKPVWSLYNSSLGSSTGTISSNGSQLQFLNSGGSLGRVNLKSQELLPDFKSGVTYYLELDTLPVDASNTSRCYITLRPTTTAFNPDSSTDPFMMDIRSTTTLRANITELFVGGVSKTPLSGDFSFPVLMQIYLATTTYAITVNNILQSSGTHTATTGKQYLYIGYFNGGASNSMYIDNFQVFPETFTFTSQPFSIGSLATSWGPVTITDVRPNGNDITYQFGSTNTATSGTTNYAAISNGGIPSVDLNLYASFKAVFYQSTGSVPASLFDFQTAWSEGTAPPLASIVYDRRYWLSFTTNTASGAFDDTVLLYQRNRTFSILKGINASSFSLWRDLLYFGNSNSTGYVYQFDTGNSDDSANINSLIVSKSYDGGFSSREKDLRNLFVEYLGSSTYTGSIAVTYDLDRAGYAFSLGSANMNEESGQVTAKFPFSLQNPTHGSECQFTFSKSGTGTRLKLYDYVVRYSVKEEK